MKKYANAALLYAIFAMVGGVLYREFTKMNGFQGKTTLSVVHTHYFMLGMFFCLIMLLVEKSFQLSIHQEKRLKIVWSLYNIGLNATVGFLILRGITQVLATPLSKGMNAAISGMAGLGHIVVSTAIILYLLAVKKEVSAQK